MPVKCYNPAAFSRSAALYVVGLAAWLATPAVNLSSGESKPRSLFVAENAIHTHLMNQRFSSSDVDVWRQVASATALAAAPSPGSHDSPLLATRALLMEECETKRGWPVIMVTVRLDGIQEERVVAACRVAGRGPYAADEAIVLAAPLSPVGVGALIAIGSAAAARRWLTKDLLLVAVHEAAPGSAQHTADADCMVDAWWRSVYWSPWASGSSGSSGGGNETAGAMHAAVATDFGLVRHVAEYPWSEVHRCGNRGYRVHGPARGAGRRALGAAPTLRAAIYLDVGATMRPAASLGVHGAHGMAPDMDLVALLSASLRGIATTLAPCDAAPQAASQPTSGRAAAWQRATTMADRVWDALVGAGVVSALRSAIDAAAPHLPRAMLATLPTAATYRFRLTGVLYSVLSSLPQLVPAPLPHTPLLHHSIPSLTLQVCQREHRVADAATPAAVTTAQWRAFDADVASHEVARQLGLSLEKVLRALCETEERLHAGLTAYLMMTAEHFVGLNELVIGAALMHIAVPLLAWWGRPSTAVLADTAVPAVAAIVVSLASIAATAGGDDEDGGWLTSKPAAILAVYTFSIVATIVQMFRLWRSWSAGDASNDDIDASRPFLVTTGGFVALLAAGYVQFALLYLSLPLFVASAVTVFPLLYLLAPADAAKLARERRPQSWRNAIAMAIRVGIVCLRGALALVTWVALLGPGAADGTLRLLTCPTPTRESRLWARWMGGCLALSVVAQLGDVGFGIAVATGIVRRRAGGKAAH